MKLWTSVIILILSIFLTWISQEAAYWLKAYFRPIYTMTFINITASLGYILSILTALILAVKLKTSQAVTTLFGVVIISLASLFLTLFITAMWWG